MKWQAIAYSGGIWGDVEADSYDEAYYKFQEIKREEKEDDYQWIRKV